ncbi:carbohydrate ABC transporter permease [Microbacterium stercoris]|uniref:Sugar ABC transporter permease n=1 Tax=Microbacterium stercoris TaxID=2820289 RepID=A0A939QGL3_9MICO|nr:sugar ABC transporter permease [Microbacterium stercoris]MBO3662542.1 sugar ABC transporter permease [Microbacterium stercoris]
MADRHSETALIVGVAARRRRGGPGGPSGRLARDAVRALPLLPAVVLLAIFLIGPVISAFFGAFTNASLRGAAARGAEFVGFRNFTDLFADPDFPKSVVITLVFLIGSAIIGQNVLGMVLALAMRSAHGITGSVVSTIVVAAWVLPEIVASFACYAFFAPEGTLNTLLSLVGITGPSWLYDWPLFSVILANTWRGTAFSMLVYSAALYEVPPEINESAEMDGARGWQRFAFITIPMIRRSISTNLMLTTLQTLSVFTLIYVMTGGGPGTDSATLPIFAYQQAFQFSELGFGTAIAVILLVVGGVFSLIYIRALRPEVD